MIGNLASVLDSPDFEARIALALREDKNYQAGGGTVDELSMAREKGTLGGAMPAGAIAGALVGFWLIDAVGRIRSLFCAALLLCVGNCGAASAGLCGPAAAKLALLLVGYGRGLAGLGVGLASVAAPPYTTEMAPRELRGALGASYQLAITSGIFLGSLFGLAVGDNGWALALAIPIPAAVLLALAATRLPESPRWLLLQAYRRPSDAERQRVAIAAAASALRQMRAAGANVDDEVSDIAASLGKSQDAISRATHSDSGMWSWDATFAATICLLQTGGGIDVVVTYGPEIYVQAGLAEEDRLVAQLGFTAVMLAVTAVAVLLVELPNTGRRRLIVFGAAGCALVVSLFSLIGEDAGLPIVLPLALGFSALYSLSWGPLAFLLATEMANTELRARCMAVGVLANFFADFLVIAAWPQMSQVLGQKSAFGVFAVINWAAVGFVYLVVEETAGKPLEALHRRSSSDDERRQLL
eukprot:COSAG02_NODE_9017_length_2359_cov_1.579646_2_plen_470_part_00